MRVILIDKHEGEGVFPIFKKGNHVEVIESCQYYMNWLKVSISGIETYAPSLFIEDSKLNCDYNPTELICDQGDEIEVLAIINEWLYSKNSLGHYGWVPAYKVVSKDRLESYAQ